jgi:Tol biopolymer transport system component
MPPHLRHSSFAGILLALCVSATLSVSGLHAQQAAQPTRNGSLPAVSPGGTLIAFVREGDGVQPGLYVIGVDGSGERRLADAPDGPPRWLPDGSGVYYSVGKFTDDSSDVRYVKLTGGSPALFERIPGRGAVLSADMKSIFAATGAYPRMELVHIPVGSHQVHQITNAPGPYFNIAVNATDEVAVTHADSGARLQVWVMQHGVAMRPVTAFAAGDGSPQWPSWSPDGRTIALQAGVYRRDLPSQNTSHIWIIDVASGAATKLAAHARPYLDETPAFFPDGKRIAFQSDRTGRMEVWVMHVNGSDARQVTR